MMADITSPRTALLTGLPGYPFFPCRICRKQGFSGKDNDGCDHTVFERARAWHPTLISTKAEVQS